MEMTSTWASGSLTTSSTIGGTTTDEWMRSKSAGWEPDRLTPRAATAGCRSVSSKRSPQTGRCRVRCGYRQWSIDDGTADGHQAIGVGCGRDNNDLDGGHRRRVRRNGGNAFPLGRRRKRWAQAQHLGLRAASPALKGRCVADEPATGNDHDDEPCQARTYESGREAADGIWVPEK